ncbi:hypothetical protein ASPZODRAFT_167767 [Penicilliopsis zonata CBS 506.65]|uniref:Uncharacterized protein n=1 Tax=Penicilliopsis zonata CBS 506.65 TaxID=1073090 RepID=A0A1L9SDU1_9EURO|nr:hypothetical protein ASPZODRAFT_167767 [Penicilliopsis zonata CBS 506.65]OJJ45308.1 hypothetical protein ASPZODRAFT_167767 [Penicilliopsis zonata CBS 506.65]
MATYLDLPIIRRYIDQAGSDDAEGRDVNNLWYQILRGYFLLEDNFCLEYEVSDDLELATRPNTVVLVLCGNALRKFLFVECKQPLPSNCELDENFWVDTRNRLKGAMERWRGEAGELGEGELFGIIAIGNLARFVTMQAGGVSLLNMHGEPVRIDTQAGASEADAMLREIRQRV